MAVFEAGLRQMLGENLAGPYEGATIDAPGLEDAIKKAKSWTATVEIREGAWLQILYQGKAAASFGPGEF